jgi:hypothetical protein
MQLQPREIKAFRLLYWILHYTLFHEFDTLGSHFREEGSLDYNEGLVRLQVQTNFDTNIYCQHHPSRAKMWLNLESMHASLNEFFAKHGCKDKRTFLHFLIPVLLLSGCANAHRRLGSFLVMAIPTERG